MGVVDRHLIDLRKRIDQIDEDIINLLKERYRLAHEVGKIKEAKGVQAFDLGREKEILKRIVTLNDGIFPEETLKVIYSEIIRACRSTQERPKVAFLGPEATFSHIAAQHYFGTSTNFIPVETIIDVFEEVSSERAHFGVVPIENSIEGVVATTLDAIYEYGLKVCGEIYEAISHHLMNQTGKLEDIKKILSHPQAIAQCRKWLRKKLPSVPVETVSSTALAAKWAAVDEGVGAIASLMAAKLYHLQIVAKNIEDIRGNSTRFWIIGKVEREPTGNDKTSLIFSVADKPGALFEVLKGFAERRINLTKIESRPSKNEPWKYIFFLDCEGHAKDPLVAECLEEMQKYCIQVVWLGSYPKGNPI
ncbi:MAG: prephenate dehydratase [Caldimicrobium sp.]|nr:prephenate dehydratase [Caldimicrobium sp.]MDW8182904.1 prephenate dehydratase [Caldimicrobium sp.]